MSFTIVPLHNLELPSGTIVLFGSGFVLQETPEWVLKDEGTLANIDWTNRHLVQHARHAFVAEYHADSIGMPDPEWHGTKPKSIQDLKFRSAMLANLAIWLRQPGPVCFTVCLHALSISDNEGRTTPVILQTQEHTRLFCHPKDAGNSVTAADLKHAGELHTILTSVPRKNPVWEALRALWAGLTMYPADYRYPFFWMALEALFGPTDAGETTFKLCQRIALFIGQEDRTIARDIFKKAKTCYGTRSKIVHGRWKDDPNIEAVMADTEAIARTALRGVIEDPTTLKIFMSRERDTFLDDLVFKQQ